MAGKVSFDSDTGFIRRKVVISQLQDCGTDPKIIIGPNGEERCDGVFPTNYYGENGCNRTEICNPDITFINDSFQMEHVREHPGLAIFFLLVGVLELIIVILIHIVTLAQRKSPSVKASSLKLLNISYVGIYILILGVFVWALFSAISANSNDKSYFCQALWAWTIPIGFSLSLSPVVMKTWRLYRIFEHYKDPGPFISTPYLIAGAMLMTFLNLVVSVTWTIQDPYYVKLTRLPMNGNMSDTLQVYFQCECRNEQVWLGSVMTLSLGLLCVGTVLALLTRNIKNSTFATSSLRVFVYLMSIVIILGSSIYSISELLRDKKKLSYLSYSTPLVVLHVVIWLFITCVFVPPLLTLTRKTKAMFKKISTTSFSN